MASGTSFPPSDKVCHAIRAHHAPVRGHGTLMRQSQRYLAVAVAALGCLTAGAVALVAAPQVHTVTIVETRRQHNARVFTAAWEWVNSHYYDATFNGTDWEGARAAHLVDAENAGDEDELYAVLARMVRGLGDMHTQILSPREVREQGHTQRTLLGFVSRPSPAAADKWTIVGVMPGSPAAGAGVQPGWTLDACDGLPPAAVLGTGAPLEAGRTVVCEFSDESDQSHRLAIAAGEIGNRVIQEARLLEGGHLYLRFDEFEPSSPAWLREQLRTHADAPGVVLDLRFNSGGEVAVLEEIAGEFLPDQAALGSLVSRDGESDTVLARRAADAASVRGRLAVLVANESMSCAEILAGALQHHHRAVVVGSPTAGMVLGTVGIPLPGGGELQLSVWDYHAPDGRRLEHVGVTPDIALDHSLELSAGIHAAVAALANSSHSADSR